MGRRVHLTPPGTGDIIAVMIPEPKGQDIVALLEQGVMVMMDITVGTRNLQKYVSRTSVVFVSISFIVLMTISLAWLVFYYIQRFRYVNARDRNQVGLHGCLLIRLRTLYCLSTVRQNAIFGVGHIKT